MTAELTIPLALFGALNVLDAISTWRVIRSGGAEANPIVRTAIRRLGFVGGMVATKAPGFIGCAVLWMMPEGWGKLIVIGMLVAYILVITRNTATAARLEAR